MDNKYYTPTIEEFHVGFEFESNYVGFSSDLKWRKILLNDSHDWFWTTYKQDAVETEFRVKHLDKEDIESLGFINNCENGYKLIKGDSYWEIDVLKKDIIITKNELSGTDEFDGQIIKDYSSFIVYRGSCNNKS